MFNKPFLMLGTGLLALAGSLSAADLRLKWDEGKSYTFGVSSSTAMTMAMGGKAMATQSDLEQTIYCEAGAHEKGIEVTTEFKDMKMDMRLNGQPMMNYDSTKNADGGILGASLKPLFDLKVSTVYGEDGKILEIGGLDGLEGLDQVGMGREQIEMMVRSSSQLVPGKEVDPGETWKASMELPMAPLAKDPAIMEFELTFEGMQEKGGKNLAHITLTGKVAVGEAAEGQAPIQLRSKSITGEMFFDVELGQPRESSMKMELEMGVPENIPLEEGAPGKFPMSVLSTQKLLSVGDAKKE